MSEKNQLEEALKKAIDEPEARGPFYQLLMTSKAFVVGREEGPEADGRPGHVQLKQWQQPDGSLALPFFTTAETLRKTLGPDESLVEIPVLDLFRLAQGTTLVLTTDEASKAFKPDEVAALLSSLPAQDPLARALKRAVEEGDERSRHDFYETLINSQIFVIGAPQSEDVKPNGGVRNMTDSDQFFFTALDHPYKEGEKILPFFSSLDHLRRILPGDGKYMGFAALTFLSMAKDLGLQLVLNPGSDPSKIFLEDEIKFLLESARQERLEPKHFQPGTKIYLEPPLEYPQEIVGALLDLLPNHRQVKAAYLTAMRENEEDPRQVMVLGFEAEGDLTDVLRAAGEVVSQHAREGMVIDFARVQEGEKGLSEYFKEKVSPFYLRSLKKRSESPKEPAPAAESDSKVLEYDQPGFFGRVKRIFGGSK